MVEYEGYLLTLGGYSSGTIPGFGPEIIDTRKQIVYQTSQSLYDKLSFVTAIVVEQQLFVFGGLGYNPGGAWDESLSAHLTDFVTLTPTEEPSKGPTVSPSPSPTELPSAVPTADPSTLPTSNPTTLPSPISLAPTLSTTTASPTIALPTSETTNTPTHNPIVPTQNPSTFLPTLEPTTAISSAITSTKPSTIPTHGPSTSSQSLSPNIMDTDNPVIVVLMACLVLAILIIAVLSWCFCRREKKRNTMRGELETQLTPKDVASQEPQEGEEEGARNAIVLEMPQQQRKDSRANEKSDGLVDLYNDLPVSPKGVVLDAHSPVRADDNPIERVCSVEDMYAQPGQEQETAGNNATPGQGQEKETKYH